MSKISNKTFKQLCHLISDVICLDNVEEFEEGYKLFNNIPEWWTDEERRICDYQGRMINELCAGIAKIFGREE
jgi:hypothetical protein